MRERKRILCVGWFVTLLWLLAGACWRGAKVANDLAPLRLGSRGDIHISGAPALVLISVSRIRQCMYICIRTEYGQYSVSYSQQCMYCTQLFPLPYVMSSKQLPSGRS